MFSQLPEDLIDRVLTHLPDFKSLWAAVRTSKAVYATFRSRPLSTLYAIGSNIASQAHPQAFDVSFQVLLKAGHTLSASETGNKRLRYGYRQGKLLLRIANVARRLEKVYGLKYDLIIVFVVHVLTHFAAQGTRPSLCQMANSPRRSPSDSVVLFFVSGGYA